MEMHIPKVIHQIWIGPNPVPDEYREWRATWKEHHPEWKCKLWGDEEVGAVLLPEVREYYEKANTYSSKSDIARTCIIYRHGGVYVDMDYECLHPIDELLHGCRAFASVSRTDGRITSALFGAEKGHPFVRKLIDLLDSQFHPQRPDKTGPLLFRKAIDGRGDVRIFEKEVFTPVTVEDKQRFETETKEDWGNSYAVHYFCGDWQSKSDFQRAGMMDNVKASLRRGRHHFGNSLRHFGNALRHVKNNLVG